MSTPQPIVVELHQIDPTKCNVLLLKVPSNASLQVISGAMQVLAGLTKNGISASVVIPDDWGVQFIEQDKLKTQEAPMVGVILSGDQPLKDWLEGEAKDAEI